MLTAADMHAHPFLDSYLAASDLRGGRFRPSSLADDRLSVAALRAGDVGVVLSSVYPSLSLKRGSAYMERCRDILDLVEAYLARNAASAVLATSPDGLARALGENRIAFIHAVEGGHVLGGRIENLHRLHGWGVRSLTLTHFMNNDLAASAFDIRRRLAPRVGLAPFGREVVAEMNALGMIVDLAHTSEAAFWQALEHTTAPVIVSHSGVRHFVPSEICLSDAQLKAIAANRGVLGIIFSSLWLRRFGLGSIEHLVENILYVCGLVGADYVGLGSDFHGTPAVRGVATAAAFARVRAMLEERGLSAPEVAAVMGDNFRRVFAEVARTS